jgi:hypothetical protein
VDGLEASALALGVAVTAGDGVAGREASAAAGGDVGTGAGGVGVYPAPRADASVSTAPLENLESSVALRNVPPWLWVPDAEPVALTPLRIEAVSLVSLVAAGGLMVPFGGLLAIPLMLLIESLRLSGGVEEGEVELIRVAAALLAAVVADDEEGAESVAVELSLVIDVVDSVRLAA